MDDLAPDHSATLSAALLNRESAAVIGRPGTGKTTLLEAVYGRLVESVDPSSILVLTPNRDHADVLRNTLPVPAEAILRAAPARSISSFAYGIARAAHATRTGEELEFVSGADQDVFLADLLAGHEAGHGRTPTWPSDITAEVRATSAFRTEIRDVLNRVMEFDFGVRLPPADVHGEYVFDAGRSALARVLATHPDPRWEAVAAVLEEYLGIMSMPGYGGIDAATVLARAAFEILREPAEVTAGRPWSFSPDRVPSVVLADGVQDFPSASWGVLEQLRERGAALALFGAPETVTGRFHGADASVLDRAASDPRFATVVLDRVVDADAELAAVTDGFGARITTRWGLGHMPRPLTPAADGAEGAVGQDTVGESAAGEPEVPESPSAPGASTHSPPREETAAPGGSELTANDAVETHVFAGAASAHRYLARRIAEYVAAGHSHSDVAVICRNASTARVTAGELRAAGTPTATIVQPLNVDPATAPLLDLLTHAPGLADDDTLTRVALSLAGSVYIRLDAVQLRRFRRLVRSAYPAADSTASLALALRDAPADSPIPGLSTLARMLRAAADHVDADPHTALWAIWEAAGVAERWQAEALRDPDGIAGAHLDSVLRLFTLAEKITDRGGFTARSFAGIVAEQDIAQDSLARSSGFADHVQVGTPASLAHLRVPCVIITDVNEGVWPNPKLRGGILGLGDLTALLAGDGPVTADPGYHAHAKRTNLREEAELFYTALTRGRDRIIVTALSDSESAPSAFFDVIAAATARGTASTDGYTLTDEDELPPLDLAEIAALARSQLLEAARDAAGEGDEPAAAADWAALSAALTAAVPGSRAPGQWREAEDVTSTTPLFTADDDVTISPSQVETFSDCSLRWFLTRHGGDRGGTTAQSIGTILHAAAEHHPTGPTSTIREYVEREFATLEFATDWEREREHTAAMAMVDRLGEYIADAPGEVLGVEAQVHATGVDDLGQEWTITGRLDRVESTADGVRIVDFKTGRTVPAGADMPRHAQLGVYQEAVDTGTLTLPDGRVVDVDAVGAELVFLRRTKSTKRLQGAVSADEDPEWARELIGEVSTRMRSADFPARVDPPKCLSCPVRSSCPAIGPHMLEDS
ncbi:UrvD/REP family ATP-dependent DNA helicase [Brevibacterium sp. XM4083]|uniref:UrvD/REP family ATP-dependent DNA helicase n=1 Tax=Brevibacterium sp. XM4083 TaxID=2583238 RepID=UPI0011274D77|nr:UrvD/REP family ATP-dependent DNA helicase [Brevibacterium sp. XM4083]MCM1012130.1 PD-(D/E)XK nuclease family protein [Brevibacterium sp. XM4083]